MVYRTRFIAFLALAGSLAAAQARPAAGSPKQTPQNSTSEANDGHDPLLDLPPLPQKPKVSLLGGIVTKLDLVRDRLTLKPFAGHNMSLTFDPRTQFYLNDVPVSQQELKPGQRIYADTMLNGDKVFAKSIWIKSGNASGQGRGQIIGFDPGDRVLTVRDEVSSQPMRFRVTPSTVVRAENGARSVSELKPGSLVTLTFGPREGKYDTLKEVSISAEPGQRFSFFGTITFIDLSRQVIAVENRNDQKTYEIGVGPLPPGIIRKLHEGSEVGVSAVFDGKQYVAKEIAPAAPVGEVKD